MRILWQRARALSCSHLNWFSVAYVKLRSSVGVSSLPIENSFRVSTSSKRFSRKLTIYVSCFSFIRPTYVWSGSNWTFTFAAPNWTFPKCSECNLNYSFSQNKTNVVPVFNACVHWLPPCHASSSASSTSSLTILENFRHSGRQLSCTFLKRRLAPTCSGTFRLENPSKSQLRFSPGNSFTKAFPTSITAPNFASKSLAQVGLSRRQDKSSLPHSKKSHRKRCINQNRAIMPP